MEKIIIDNGFFAREADPSSPADQELLTNAVPGQAIIYEELDDETAARTRLYMEEMEKASYIVSRPKAYEKTLFYRYTSLSATLFVLTRWERIHPIRHISEDLMPMVHEMQKLREKLVPLRDPEEDLWYIWGDAMPHQEVSSQADWRMAFDTPGFRPFLIPYMLQDQKTVMGNIIVVSGGAFEWRSNRWEGYEAVHRFNELGYNAFLLQRRVAPYDKLDGAMDLQRAIRYLRAHAGEFGIAAIDSLAVNGYSGGGWCICDMLSDCFEFSMPDTEYPDYVPDRIDRLSSKVDAALLLYGAASEEKQIEQMKNNPTLPPIFMTVGQKDRISAYSIELYQRLSEQVPVELHIFAGTGHGFGVGPSEDVTFAERPVEGILTNVAVWPEMADKFLKVCFGLEQNFIPNENH